MLNGLFIPFCYIWINNPSSHGRPPDGQGNLYLLEKDSHRIRRIELDGHVSTFVGNGQAGAEKEEANSAPALNGPRLEVAITPTSLVLGTDGTLYFSSGQHLFRTVTR